MQTPFSINKSNTIGKSEQEDRGASETSRSKRRTIGAAMLTRSSAGSKARPKRSTFSGSFTTTSQTSKIKPLKKLSSFGETLGNRRPDEDTSASAASQDDEPKAESPGAKRKTIGMKPAADDVMLSRSPTGSSKARAKRRTFSGSFTTTSQTSKLKPIKKLSSFGETLGNRRPDEDDFVGSTVSTSSQDDEPKAESPRAKRKTIGMKAAVNAVMLTRSPTGSSETRAKEDALVDKHHQADEDDSVGSFGSTPSHDVEAKTKTKAKQKMGMKSAVNAVMFAKSGSSIATPSLGKKRSLSNRRSLKRYSLYSLLHRQSSKEDDAPQTRNRRRKSKCRNTEPFSFRTDIRTTFAICIACIATFYVGMRHFRVIEFMQNLYSAMKLFGVHVPDVNLIITLLGLALIGGIITLSLFIAKSSGKLEGEEGVSKVISVNQLAVLPSLEPEEDSKVHGDLAERKGDTSRAKQKSKNMKSAVNAVMFSRRTAIERSTPPSLELEEDSGGQVNLAEPKAETSRAKSKNMKSAVNAVMFSRKTTIERNTVEG